VAGKSKYFSKLWICDFWIFGFRIFGFRVLTTYRLKTYRTRADPDMVELIRDADPTLPSTNMLTAMADMFEHLSSSCIPRIRAEGWAIRPP
jgi:hypothetical protein